MSELLERQLAEANAESKARKTKLRKLAAERAQLQEERDRLTKERDDLAAKLQQQPDDLRAELDATKGKLREVVHKGLFAKVAKSLGANEGAVDDLWHVSGYKPEADEADEAVIKSTLAETLKSKPYFLAPQPTQANGKLTAGPGVSRGATTSNGFTITKSEMREIANSPRRKEYLEAAKAGNVTIVED